MIPPLEDEIDEEDDAEKGIEDNKPQSPTGQGIPPVEEEMAPLEETPSEETLTDVSKKDAEASERGEVKQGEVKNCPAADIETKEGEALSEPTEEKLQDSADKAADPPESKEEEPNTAKEKEKKEEEGETLKLVDEFSLPQK